MTGTHAVLGRLASALGRNDERPNVELAEELAAAPDAGAVAALVGALAGKSDVANDAIKVLYELGERRPELVAGHVGALLGQLSSRNNRMVWGALSAIDTLAGVAGAEVKAALPAILVAADKGSVIAKDKAVAILVKLGQAGEPVGSILLERLQVAAPNQFPTYAEAMLPVLQGTELARLKTILEARLPDVAGAKRVRVEKLLKTLAKMPPYSEG